MKCFPYNYAYAKKIKCLFYDIHTFKDNGLQENTTMFSGRALGGNNSVIKVTGRTMSRTWSLLTESVSTGSSSIRLMHSPLDMGWRVGDRIVLSPSGGYSSGTAEGFMIAGFRGYNEILLSKSNSYSASAVTKYAYTVKRRPTNQNEGVALLAAEVINLSRNVLITGDDFKHVPCDPSLRGPITSKGCACNAAIGRNHCTVGLHTMMTGSQGLIRVQYARIEKCGQRGIQGKYCLHFHRMKACPNCLFKGNAIEFSQQRGIAVHGTHLSVVSENVLNDVRGTSVFIEDGNELYNRVEYNVAICPWAFKDPNKHGCTVPGTDDDQADTANNQAGIWLISPTNHLIGNRMSNHFNGMFLQQSNGMILLQYIPTNLYFNIY